MLSNMLRSTAHDNPESVNGKKAIFQSIGCETLIRKPFIREPLMREAFIVDELKRLIVLTLVLILLIFNQYPAGLAARAGAKELTREEIQTAMVIKFMDFIEWPADSFEDGYADTITIGLIDADEYQGLFDPFTTHQFNGKKLRVVNFSKIEDIGKLQILVVGSSGGGLTNALVNKFRGKPVLTVGDSPGFAEKGGMVNFFRRPGNRIGFEINMKSKTLSGIKISSHLLRLGKIVDPESQFEKVNRKTPNPGGEKQ